MPKLKLFMYGLFIITVAFLYIKSVKYKNDFDLSQTKIEALIVETKARKVESTILKKSINGWESSQNALIEEITALEQVSDKAMKETRRLLNVFSDHNIKSLAWEKPAVIQRRLNSGTTRAFLMLECASGYADSCRSGSKKPKKGASSKTAANKSAKNLMEGINKQDAPR